MKTEREETIEELEARLKKAKEAEARKKRKEREDYEVSREKMIQANVAEAIALNKMLEDFKTKLHDQVEAHRQRMNEYGEIPTQSKGGFSLKSKDGQWKLTVQRQTTPEWDERSVKAEELIKDFLKDTVKKKDQDTYEVLLSYIQRNANGDLNYSQVMILLNHEDRWDDKRWKEGLKLIKESYSLNMKAYTYLFHKLDKNGKPEQISLNFSSI